MSDFWDLVHPDTAQLGSTLLKLSIFEIKERWWIAVVYNYIHTKKGLSIDGMTSRKIMFMGDFGRVTKSRRVEEVPIKLYVVDHVQTTAVGTDTQVVLV